MKGASIMTTSTDTKKGNLYGDTQKRRAMRDEILSLACYMVFGWGNHSRAISGLIFLSPLECKTEILI